MLFVLTILPAHYMGSLAWSMQPYSYWLAVHECEAAMQHHSWSHVNSTFHSSFAWGNPGIQETLHLSKV